MSIRDPVDTSANHADPYDPDSPLWFDPTIRRNHDPPSLDLSPRGIERLPLWPTVLLALPVGVAILAMDPTSGWLIRIGWIPLLVAVCAYLAWWHLIRRR
jgi:uncharacterized RDD family membrane protein YckC